MKTIGITGGIGAGKSEILKYIKENYNCDIILADNLAYELESPGNKCYEDIVLLLGRDILDEDGFINKKAMASRIFSDDTLKAKVNGIIHPAVKEYILNHISELKKAGTTDFFFLEAALLIEEKYDTILDELWYIRVSADIRKKRLKQSRGYSDEKSESIIRSQLPDSVFAGHCQVIIDNSGELKDTYAQIDEALRNEGK